MQRTVAIKKLGSLLGKDFGYRVDAQAPSAEERAAAREQAKALNQQWTEASKAEAERVKIILAADADYQRLRAEVIQLRKAKDNAWSQSRRYRFTVGKTVAGLFFSVMAEGDSWEDVIAKLATKKTMA